MRRDLGSSDLLWGLVKYGGEYVWLSEVQSVLADDVVSICNMPFAPLEHM